MTTDHFFVYTLNDPRPDQQPIFYVGKATTGTGRPQKHFRNFPKRFEGEGGSAKHKRITEIRDAGWQPQAKLVQTFINEDEALRCEEMLINSIGLDELTNQNGGGGGDRANVVPINPDVKHHRLTTQQELYAQHLANPRIDTQREAYMLAYPAARKWEPASVDTTASRIASNIKIVRRVEELQAPMRAGMKATFEEIAEGFRDANKVAKDTSNAGAMTGALKELAKISSIYPEAKPNIETQINIQDNSTHNTQNLNSTEKARRVAHLLEAGIIDV